MTYAPKQAERTPLNHHVYFGESQTSPPLFRSREDRAVSDVRFDIPQDRLAELRCRFPTCSGAPVGVFHVPEGCNCWPDPLQALCAQHAVKVHSTGPISLLLDFRAPASEPNEKSPASRSQRGASLSR
jgi:hypothetical protein